MREYALFFVILFFVSSAFAQITITSADAFNLIGTPGQLIAQDNLEDQTILVDIGSAGANQTWDYSTLTFPADTFLIEFITPQSTPFVDTFPNSNLVQKMTLENDQIEFIIYQYIQVLMDSMKFLGLGSQAGGITQEVERTHDFAVLPFTYETTWTINYTDTIDEFQGGLIVETDHIEAMIDSWGSVTTPAGTFDCLRLHTEWQSIENWIGPIAFTDTSYGANISWISLSSIEVASFNFEYDGQTPQYTEADEVSLLIEIGPGSIEDNDNIVADFQLYQNFPNPYNPVTTIGFTLPMAANTTLEIYALSGQKVATVLDKMLSAGPHDIIFNAASLSSGIYLYRLRAGIYSATKKMIVIK